MSQFDPETQPTDATATQPTALATTQPPAPIASQPVAPQPVTPQVTPPTQPQAPTPQGPTISQHAKIFDHILNSISPPINYVDANGQPQTVPQSRGSLGKAVVASVLAGMFSGGDKTSPGAGGVPRNDPGKAMSQGYDAGQTFQAGRQQQAQ